MNHHRGNTPLHFSVLNGKNESYRYLRQLGASESSRNDDHLTPLQMAVKLGGRCTQGQVYLDHKDAGEHQLIVRPQLLPISDKNQTMAVRPRPCAATRSADAANAHSCVTTPPY